MAKQRIRMPMRILILTDSTEYGPEATLYPLVRGLAAHGDVDAVWVADRAIADNRYFYGAMDPQARTLYAHAADAEYAYETKNSYPEEIIQAADADAVWLRLDLASDSFLHYVEHMWGDRFISNRPSGIIRTSTKAFLLPVRQLMDGLMPRVKLCYDLGNVKEFQAQCPDMVLKVLRSFGGKGVVRVRRNGDSDLGDDTAIERFMAENGPCIAMEYLDNPNQSDNRLIVSNGVILGTLARVPKPGEWLCNITAGGSYAFAEADARELDIVRRIDPAMRELGLHFYGVDTLLNHRGERVLSEINTMNVGGAYRYELATGKPVCKRIAEDFMDNAREAAALAGRPAHPPR